MNYYSIYDGPRVTQMNSIRKTAAGHPGLIPPLVSIRRAKVSDTRYTIYRFTTGRISRLIRPAKRIVRKSRSRVDLVK